MIDRGGPLTPRQRAKERAVVLALRRGLGALVRLDGAVYAYRPDGTSTLLSYTTRRDRAWIVALETLEALPPADKEI